MILLHDSALYAEREDARATIEAVPLIAAAASEAGIKLVSLEMARVSPP